MQNRKMKRVINRLEKKLAFNSFVIGCRGHPGIIIKKTIHRKDWFGSDVVIKSLIDGVEESCSIKHCSPDPITGEYARWLTDPFNFEIEKIRDFVRWFATFTDFCKDYTEKDFAESKLKILTRLNNLPLFDDYQQQTYDKLKQALDRAIANKPFNPPEIFSFKSFRYKGKPRPKDFATLSEIEKINSLQKV